MATNAARRRQRSVRVTVSITLLAVATGLVLLALPTQSPLLLSIASVASLVLGWAALRMMWTEVLQSRRESAVDRAATASAYKTLFSRRAEEHAEFTTAMTERLGEAQLTQRELEGALAVEQKRAAFAEKATKDLEKVRKETAEKLLAANKRVTVLEQDLVTKQAELEAARADALASWEPEVVAKKSAAS